MDLAQYNFAINPVGLAGSAAANYSRRVHEHLRWIHRTRTGRILLNSIRFQGQPVSIQPFTGGICNATGGGLIGGAGTVSYSPDTFALHGACPANTTTPNRGLLWDEILFHELVHVFRTASGKWSQRPLTGALFRYTDTEEFYAVMVTNIYIADRTNRIKTGLRADHKGFNPLPTSLSEPFGFFFSGKQTFALVKQFVEDHRGFATRIANDVSNARFNPIADYYADRDKCRRLSDQAWDAKLEDLIKKVASIF
jgi:hypothetical protein